MQSGFASTLKRVLDRPSLGRYQRGVLTEFLSASTGYAPVAYRERVKHVFFVLVLAGEGNFCLLVHWNAESAMCVGLR